MRGFAYALAVAAAIGLAGCEAREAPADNEANATAPASEEPLAITASDANLQWGDCPAPLPAGCQLAVLHGDPAKPNADVLLKVPAGAVIPPHTHSSAERMVLVAGQLDVHYQGASPATLLPGTYAYGPAKLSHTATCASADPCTLFIAFEGPVDVAPYEGAIE